MFARLFGFIGALFGLAAVALASVASHAIADPSPDEVRRLAIGLAFLFGHALLLIVVSLVARGALVVGAGVAIALGTLVFSGSLVGSALLGWPTVLAPFGGGLLMLGWLVLAVALPLRRA